MHGRRDEAGWRLVRLEARVEASHEGRAVALIDLAYGDGERASHFRHRQDRDGSRAVAVRQIAAPDARSRKPKSCKPDSAPTPMPWLR